MGKSKSLIKEIPLWKKWLSYLFEIDIEHSGSEINPHLSISIHKGRLQLYTDNAIYSFEDLYDNFANTFQKIDFTRGSFNQILLLGFGLGSIPYMLEKKFALQAEYVGIEIDEEIIRMASEYALPKLQSPCTLICTDAYPFVELTEQRFDMVVVDLFIDNTIPSKFEEMYFLENVRDLLKPNGLLLYNRLTATEQDKEAYEAFFVNRFNPIFSNAIAIEVTDNTILLNTPKYLKTKQ